jgi:hypothetical protein
MIRGHEHAPTNPTSRAYGFQPPGARLHPMITRRWTSAHDCPDETPPETGGWAHIWQTVTDGRTGCFATLTREWDCPLPGDGFAIRAPIPCAAGRHTRTPRRPISSGGADRRAKLDCPGNRSWGNLGPAAGRSSVSSAEVSKGGVMSIDPTTAFWLEMNRRAVNDRGFLSGKDRTARRPRARLRKRRG